MRELLFRRQPKFRSDRADERRAQVPDDLWQKCPGCDDLIYTRELARSLHVCPRCGHHFRLTARQRIEILADDESFEEWDSGLRTADPLAFSIDGERYPDKAAATAERAGVDEAVVSGSIKIDGRPFAVVVTDFSFMGASMGSVYGEKLARTSDRALEGRMPLLTISASGGARMQEGMLALLQMAKTTAAIQALAAEQLPHFSLLVDPCYGGVTASYAAVADVVMAEPGARIGFAGPRVIEQVTRQKLPEGFQTAEFLIERGMLDRIVPRAKQRSLLVILHDIYTAARRPGVPGEAPAIAGPNGARDDG